MREIGHEAIRTASRWGIRGKVAVGVGLVACSTVVWQSSHAAFSGTTESDGNNLAAGTVTIADNDLNAATLTSTNLAPGGTAVSCIAVRYTGSLANPTIKMYVNGATETNNSSPTYVAWAADDTSEMDTNTKLQIEVSSADIDLQPTLGDCTLAAGATFSNVTAAAPGTALNTLIGSNANNYTTGSLASGWGTVTVNKWRLFRFTSTLSSTAPNTVQGDGVKYNVVWEAQA